MPYPDSHPLNGAFLARWLDRLSDLIVLQGDELLRDAELDMPSRAVSLMLLIGERGQLSAADAATELGQPHQLVTQRADVLLDLNLVVRKDDPTDGRRKLLALSAKGKLQHDRLLARLSEASVAFAGLFDEIECDLFSVSAKALEALNCISLLERIRENVPPNPGKGPAQRRTRK